MGAIYNSHPRAHHSYIQKLVPVTHTCKATLEAIVATLPALLQRHFLQEHVPPRTFAIAFKARNCDLKREAVLTAVCDVAKAGGRHRVRTSRWVWGLVCGKKTPPGHSLTRSVAHSQRKI
jgi:hypothetical protein